MSSMTADGQSLYPHDASLPLRTRLALLTLLGLALCITLLLWSIYSARNTPRAPSEPESASAMPQPSSTPTALLPTVPEKATNPIKPPTEEALALAEVEVLKRIATEDPVAGDSHAFAWFKPYTESSLPAVREAAIKALMPFYASLDASARTSSRAAAELAVDLAAEKKFTSALEALSGALNGLPADSPWAAKSGRKQLESLVVQITNSREDERSLIFNGLEERLRAGNADAATTLKSLLNHNEPSFKQTAAEIQKRVSVELAKQNAERRQREAVARVAWADFYRKYDSAVANGELSEAEKLCSPAPTDPILTGGVSSPEKVLEGCKSDLKGMRDLISAVLEAATKNARPVDLHLHKGHVEGTLEGVEGRQLRVALSGGGKVGVKVENLSGAAILNILGEPSPALWAMMGSENPEKAQALFTAGYASIKTEIPFHWAQRFKLDKLNVLEQDTGKKIAELSEALEANKPEQITAALDAARLSVAAFGNENLSDEHRKVLESAEQIVGHAVRKKLVLQNGFPAGLPIGGAPVSDYSGFNTDQITDYRDSVRKTDVGVKYGLKVGASGGLQRVLIRFDGLEAALNNARVRKATLEFYQVDSPQANGATIGLFRLKKAWVPDSGSWLGYSTAKGADWALPGASGENDVESKEESMLKLDQKKSIWRSWDVTQYVQDILSGKAQNNGLLMRVINGEPDHHVRFYPETDIEGNKDKTLRPRLILEVERDE